MARRCVGAKKIVRLHRFFLHQISLESKLNGRQKVKGGNGSITASISTSIIASISTSINCIDHHPEPRSGLCPELLADFRIPKPPGCSGGTEGSFLCSLSSRFSGRGGGVGSLPRAWRRVGVPGAAGAKKNCEIGVGFSFAALSVFRLRRAEAASAVWIPHWHWEPFESQGARAAKGWT